MRGLKAAFRWGGIAAGLLCVMLARPAAAQQRNSNVPPTTGAPNYQSSSGTGMDEPVADPAKDRMDAERAKAQMDDRHKRLIADAQKLLELATELKADVDKTSKNDTSVTVVKKAAEMEKLARDLKERMRD
jgi:hypothetical protein